MKKENSTNLQKYSGIAEQMLKLFSKHPETAKVLFDIIIYENEGKETELVQLIRQLKDYVILERKDYEKLVQIVLLAGAYNLGFFIFFIF